MQSDHKEIYRLTSARTQVPVETYKLVGTFVQKAIYDTLRDPPKLIIKIKGLGRYYLRRKRMKITIDMYPPHYHEGKTPEFDTERAFLNYLDRKKIFDLFSSRLKDYDTYIEKRDRIKKLRAEYEKNSIPPGTHNPS